MLTHSHGAFFHRRAAPKMKAPPQGAADLAQRGSVGAIFHRRAAPKMKAPPSGQRISRRGSVGAIIFQGAVSHGISTRHRTCLTPCEPGMDAAA